MIAGCGDEQIQHPADAVNGGFAHDPTTFGRDNNGHDAEAGSANGGLVVRCICARSTPVGREAADRMAPVPEKLEGLALHDLEQLLIGQFRQRCGFH